MRMGQMSCVPPDLSTTHLGYVVTYCISVGCSALVCCSCLVLLLLLYLPPGVRVAWWREKPRVGGRVEGRAGGHLVHLGPAFTRVLTVSPTVWPGPGCWDYLMHFNPSFLMDFFLFPSGIIFWDEACVWRRNSSLPGTFFFLPLSESGALC